MKQLNTKKLTFLALMIAMQIVLARTLGIDLGNYQRISFSFIPLSLASASAGPILGGISAAIADIIGFMLKPTGPYFPGFTLNAVLSAAIYGAFYYKKNLSLKRIMFANIVVTVCVNVCLGTYWIHLLYGSELLPLLMTKLPFQGLMLVIKIIVQAAILERLTKESMRLFNA